MVGYGRFVLGWIFVLVVLLVPSLGAAGEEGPTLRLQELPNGLRAGVMPLPSSHALIVLRVGAGFVDERPHEIGVAHWLEHGLFRGTRRLPTKQNFERELSRLGIQYNASTTFERTNYFFIVPKENLREAIPLFADMIAEPVLSPADMKAELEPVKQEALREMVNPGFDLFMSSMALHGQTPRMQQLMTGTPEQMDAQSGELPRKFYQRWYSASNMTAAVVGGIENAPEIQALLSKELSRIKRFHVPPRGSFQSELRSQSGLTMYTVKSEPGSARLLNLAFPMSYSAQNEAAARILAKFMNRADSPLSIFKHQGLADSVGVSVEALQDVMFVRMIFSLSATGEQNIGAIVGTVSQILGSVQKNGLPQHVLGEMKASIAGSGMQYSLREDIRAILTQRHGRHGGAHSSNFNLMGLGDMITDGLASPEGPDAITKRQDALLGTTQDDIRWLATQMPPEKARLTLRSPNASGEMHPVVRREVGRVDLAPLLPKLADAYRQANLRFKSEPNPYLEEPAVRRLRNEVQGADGVARVQGIDVLLVPAEAGKPAEALLEFRLPRAEFSSLELVGIEVALKAFQLHPGNAIFFDRILEAGIELGFSLDKSEMRLYVQASGQSAKTSQALQEFVGRLREFEPTEALLQRAVIQISDAVRAQAVSEVGRQAVSAGIKKLIGGSFIEPSSKLELLQELDLATVSQLLKNGQSRWAVRGVIRSSWEDATLERLVEMIVPPEPLVVRPLTHDAAASTHSYNEVEVMLAGVDRQGVARLYPVAASEFGPERYALEIFAKVLSDRLMQTVRTEMKLAYAVGAGVAVLPRGAVLYLTGDTSESSQRMLEGYERVMREFLNNGMTEDEFRNAKTSVLQEFVRMANGVKGQYASAFEGLGNPNALHAELKSMTAAQVLLTVRPLIEGSRKMDSVVVSPADPICERLLVGR